MDVYILGYPFGIGPVGLPVWKRGSMASEPDVLLPVQLHLLVDTASRPGMSGSPVIRRSWGTHQMKSGSVEVRPGAATDLIGVYSGRFTATDPLDAQLGIAWSSRYISEIVAGGRRDR